MNIILEKIDAPGVQKYIEEEHERNGHDCWGNYEYTTRKYVMVNGKQQYIYKGWYIIHDDIEVISTGLISLLDQNLQNKLNNE